MNSSSSIAVMGKQGTMKMSKNKKVVIVAAKSAPKSGKRKAYRAERKR